MIQLKVQTDAYAGLQPLVPYMTKMLADQVKKSLKSVKSLSLLLKVRNA